MASTYSALKIELIGTGDQAGTWGNTTNTNLGTAIEEAITGSADVAFSSADVTLTLTDTNASQTGRNLRLNLTGTSGGARNLIVSAIEKQYIVNNGLADTITIRNSTGTGIAIPSGRTMTVFNNATSILDVTTYLSSLSLGNALPATSGGTGLTSGTSGGILYFSATGNIASSNVLTASALVVGGGANLTPFTTTTGNGVITALGNNVNTAGGFTTGNGTVTLSNKRIDPRVSSNTSTASLTPNIATFDQFNLTAQAAALTVNAPTGTPVDGNKLIFRFLDNGTVQSITWNATYVTIGTTLPTNTTASKMLYVGCIYNSSNTRWDVVAVTTQV
jgi:hypothetical protein